MKQKLKLLRLVIIIGFMFMQDFFKYSIMELNNTHLFNMADYSTCLERATAILMKSLERALKFYACAIAHHRESDNHNEDRSAEIKELGADLSDGENKASTRGWWLV